MEQNNGRLQLLLNAHATEGGEWVHLQVESPLLNFYLFYILTQLGLKKDSVP